MIDPDLPLRKIVSGGQTGADRAALDWAIANSFPHGGWCPRGRKAEDGVLSTRYELEETESANYAVRTKRNVRDSDGTVIFSLAPELSGGSGFTRDLAKKLGKNWLHLSGVTTKDPAMALRRFIDDHFIETLNVAGPRGSNEPQVEGFVIEVLNLALVR